MALFFNTSQEKYLILQIIIISSGQCLNFTCMFILLPMLRLSVTKLRQKGFNFLLPLDKHVSFHALTGKLIGVYSIIHTVAHLVNLGRSAQAKNQYRKFETNIPRKGIARPQSQFSPSCVCERFMYSHDGSAYPAAGNMGLRSRTSQKRNKKIGFSLQCSAGIVLAGLKVLTEAYY